MATLKSRPAAAALAWSPLGPYLAAGSAAGAIDVTFSSASSLEVGIFSLSEEEEEKRGGRSRGPKQSNGKKTNATSLSAFPSLLASFRPSTCSIFISLEDCERSPDAVRKGEMRRSTHLRTNEAAFGFVPRREAIFNRPKQGAP